MVKRYLLTGLMAGFLGIDSALYAGESEIILKDNTTASGLTIKEETTNTTIARFRGDGNVGIGTASPETPLQIGSNGTSWTTSNIPVALAIGGQSAIGWDGPGSGVGTRAIYGYNQNLYFSRSADTDIDATANAVTHDMVITSGGNVGIGTTEPGYKLHVVNNADGEPTTIFENDQADAIEKYTAIRLKDPSNWYSEIRGVRTGALAFATNDTTTLSEKMRILGNGNVGIGTTNPVTLLHLSGTPYITLERTGTYARKYDIGFNFDDFLIRDVTANAERIVITDSGNVGIGTTSPQHPLHMGSGAHVTTGGVWTDASSREYKENIRDLTVDEAMQTLDGLRPSRFNYKVDGEDEYVGFIAEDVPELVATRDRKGLSPMDLTAVLTKVVQEQQRMLQAQQEAMDKMKQEIKMLKSAMNYGVKGL